MTTKTNQTATIEQAFAIGRSATKSTHKTCTRCKGTGWWQFGRKCFKCGGVGNFEKTTNATRLRDALAHRAELLNSIATNEKLLAGKLAAGRPRWTWMGMQERIDGERTTLATVEAQVLSLGGSL
jgi:hypothetical protein